MPTYIMLANWTDQGARQVKESPKRVDAAKRSLLDMGGEFKALYMTMGDYDLIVVYEAPRLRRLLADPDTVKLFHFARFDLAMLYHYLGTMPRPVYCTKIASRLARTFTDRHGLRDLCKDLLGVDLTKQQQQSDWGAAKLTPEQLQYAASDVLHLHALRDRLDTMLKREQRLELALACFAFLPIRAQLDLAGYAEVPIFEH